MIKINKLYSRKIKDKIFESGTKVVVVKQLLKKDPTFPKGRLGQSATVLFVKLEKPYRIITVEFSDKTKEEFFPEELTLSLL